MSYILDALNKSEQERRGQATPDLNTIHRAPPPKKQQRSAWVWVVVFFAVVNVTALSYWLFTSQVNVPTQSADRTYAPEQPSHAAGSSQQQRATQSSSPTKPSAMRPTPTTTVDFQNATNTDLLITPDKPFIQSAAEPVRISELPLNIQRQIPDLVFSSHLYSDEASFRMVNINGKMIREGDMVADELKLVEISEEGVVLSYSRHVFEVSVLRDWSAN